MLKIHNNPDGTIAETNYWESEYAANGLVYLSRHNQHLRLLLPTELAAVWREEVGAATHVVIEPTVHMDSDNHIDIVFDDDTPNPYSLMIDRQQTDDMPRKDDYLVTVYAGSLEQSVDYPCKIDLPQQKEPFLVHVTLSGTNRRSYRRDVTEYVVEMMSSRLQDMYAGYAVGIIDNTYAVKCEWHNAKAAGFAVCRIEGNVGIDIAKIAVCRHSKRAVSAWRFVGGAGEHPPAPFVVGKIVDENIIAEDVSALEVVDELARDIAWTWIESLK